MTNIDQSENQVDLTTLIIQTATDTKAIVDKLPEIEQISTERCLEHDQKIKSLLGLKSWVIAAIIAVFAGALAFTAYSYSADASQAANITSNHESIERHEAALKDLPTKTDLKLLKATIEAVPQQVRDLDLDEPATSIEIAQGVETLPLKRHERTAIQKILTRARIRETTEEE